MIARDCVEQRHALAINTARPWRPCPNYCECWCHKPEEKEIRDDR